MPRNVMLPLVAGVCLLTTGCPGTGPGAETRTFNAALDGDQEVPAVDTQATGMGSFTLDPDTGVLAYEVSYTGLSGPVTGAHLHNAPTGQEAGVSEDLTAAFAGDTDGVVEASATLDAGQIAALIAGNLYINLHTTANPDGEIRGQLEEAP